MIISGEVRKEKREIIPAVTHADNTARVQTVNRQQNKKFYSIIKEFYNQTFDSL